MKVEIHFSLSMTMLVIVLLFSISMKCSAQSTIVVDFGSSPSGNVYGMAGWNNILVSSNLEYTSEGPGGVRVARDQDELTDFMGVRGNARKFNRGERIVVTWYNTSDDTITFTSRISFNDSDVPDGGSSNGEWYTMRRFTDYRYAYGRISPHATHKTAFNIETSGVHKTDGTYNLLNINLHIEWGANDQKLSLICDKIELMNDADIQPPSQPTGLKATTVSDSKIRLDWNTPNDNTGVVEYLIYLNGQIEGYSRVNNYTAALLEPSTNCSFTVTALDHCRNESAQSSIVNAATQSYKGHGRIIHPKGFQYLGAIRMPESVNWGGEALAYNPLGDGGPTGVGAADGYPGSLFTSNINTPENGHIGELTIPAPKITSNIDELNEPSVLQNVTDIRPANVNAWPYIDIWHTGLCCVPITGTLNVALYSSWGFQYQVQGDKTASLSSCDAANLSGSVKNGAWYIGSQSTSPLNAALNDYLFITPDDWASANTSGRSLVTGRNRQGGLSGLGPSLYAVAPVNQSSPPVANTELSLTALLQYGPVEGADDYLFPNSFINYNHADWFRGASWINAGNQNAVALIGNKARGNTWYGYTGERMPHESVIADIPYPPFADTDPDGKGWRGHNAIPMIVLYDPDDLAKVANGTLQSFVPQPYAAIRCDTSLFYGRERIIRDITYDAIHQLLFVVEFIAELDGRVIIHTWRVNAQPTHVQNGNANVPQLKVYPNPAVNVITLSSPKDRSENAMKTQSFRIIDLLGRVIWSGEINDQIQIDISLWTPGMYAVIIQGNRIQLIIKR